MRFVVAKPFSFPGFSVKRIVVWTCNYRIVYYQRGVLCLLFVLSDNPRCAATQFSAIIFSLFVENRKLPPSSGSFESSAHEIIYRTAAEDFRFGDCAGFRAEVCDVVELPQPLPPSSSPLIVRSGVGGRRRGVEGEKREVHESI